VIRVLAAVVVPPHLSVSGGARAAEQLSAALAPHCDITVASMMNGTAAGTASFAPGRARRVAVRSWRPAGVPWSRLPDRYSTLFYRSDLSDIITRGDYDLVHLHNPLPALEMARVARACLARRIPYVVSTHGINEVANGSRIYGFDRLRRLAWDNLVVRPVSQVMRQASAIFALSPADVPIVRAMGFRGEPDIVCNGVPMPSPARPSTDAAALRRLGIPVERRPDQITCMFLANHTPNKGLPQLLEAVTRLDRPCLLIVGGERRDAIDYDRYLRACKPGQEIIVTGRVGDDDVAAMFRRSDLFVFPTLADTFPLVVLEAMSHGLPVLATRVGGIPHQVDATCGALVDPDDPAQIAAAIDRLADDPSHLRRLGERARGRVMAEFVWERAAERAMDGYRRVLGLKEPKGQPPRRHRAAEQADAG
jgi:glycosyltransferase involved in cell wall biosynthesis